MDGPEGGNRMATKYDDAIEKGADLAKAGAEAALDTTKPWYTSKALITSAVAFGVAVATAVGVLDSATGITVESCLVPLILAFIRVGDKTLTK